MFAEVHDEEGDIEQEGEQEDQVFTEVHDEEEDTEQVGEQEDQVLAR